MRNTFVILATVFCLQALCQVENDLQKIYAQNTVFMFGEDRHNVRSTDSLKTTQLKKIINDKPIVLFESGLAEIFAANYNNILPTSSIYPIWKNKFYDSLFVFLKNNQIKWYGLDIQPCNFSFSTYLSDVIKKAGLHCKNIDSALVHFSFLKQRNMLSKKELTSYMSQRDNFLHFYNEILNSSSKIASQLLYSEKETAYFIQAIKSRMMLVDEIPCSLANKELLTYRDSCMYQNYIFLNNQFNIKSKVIVLAHNYHISNSFKNYTPFGSYIYKSNPETVSVGIMHTNKQHLSVKPKSLVAKTILKNSNCDFYLIAE